MTNDTSLGGLFAPGVFVEHMAAHDGGVCKRLLGSKVIVVGSTPLDEQVLRSALKACAIEVWPIEAPVPDVLILGHEGWLREDLEAAVMRHNYGRLRVYSHEMLLASLITGVDVFLTRSTDELETFAQGHPGLEYLADGMGFAWPTTEVTISEVVRIVADLGDSPDLGVLKHLGYKVGKYGGTNTAERRKTLDKVFWARLVPSPGNAAYVSEWGSPGSGTRLHKMANCLASFARTAKHRRAGDLSVAIREWEDDLDYLYRTYYVTRQGFEWPASGI
jgi:hypothetical protein